MNLSWIEKKRKEIIYTVFLILIVSVFYSKFVLSLSMIAIILIALLRIDEQGKINLNPEWLQLEGLIRKNKPYLSLCFIFLMVLFTLFHSENVDDLFWQLKLKLPFLLLPVAFLVLPPLTKKEYYGLYYFLVGLVTISSVFVLINYYANFDSITQSIGSGKSFPTPIDHIKYSLFVAVSIISGIVLILDKYRIKYPWERPLLITAVSFLFVFIHILSVRSGLAALYISIIVLGVSYTIKAKNKLPFVVAAVFLLASPFISYQVFPSFKNKIDYSLWDLKMYKQGGGENYSDSGRIRSIKVGLEIAKEYPFLGVGFGDVRDVCRLKYQKKYGHEASSLFPHNQYLTIFVASGIAGLLLFLFALFQPLFYNRAYKEPAFLGFSVIIWVSFLVENTIERSYSIGLFLIFTLVSIHYIRGERKAVSVRNNS